MSAKVRQFLALHAVLVAGLASVAGPDGAAFASPTKSVEQQSAWLSSHLKPISDDEWKNIAGPRTSEKYEIARGDTLYGISKRLFGDAKYWPKIWALNNDSITNPHLIRPGNSIAFLPGSGVSLPAVAIQQQPIATLASNASAANKPGPASVTDEFNVPRSDEWKSMPRQSWEKVPLQLPPDVDPQGFDKRSYNRVRPSTGFELPAIAISDKLTPLGEVIGGRSESSLLSLGDTVYIRPDDSIQLGDTYALAAPPSILKSRKSDRVGYSISILGKVKIIGVKDSQFVGVITAAQLPIPRGSKIIAPPARFRPMQPIPGPNPIEGVLLIDKNFASYAVAQHKEVFVDRGSEDGVQPGMIFRVYQHRDPSTGKTITESDYIIHADIQIVQVSERFSSGMIIRSLSQITEESPVVLLTDVSDVLSARKQNEKSLDQKEEDKELDNLDRLDSKDGLGVQEQKELKQLENWKQNQAPPSPAPSATPEAQPNEATPPPPPPAPETTEVPVPTPAPEAPPVPDTAPPPAPLPDAAQPLPATEPAGAAPSTTTTESSLDGSVPPPDPAALEPPAPPPPPSP